MRIRCHWPGAKPQCRVAIAVHEIEDETNAKPPYESHPRNAWQSPHDKDASCRTNETHRPDKRNPEWTRSRRITVSKDKHANADEHKSEERSDIGEIISLAGVTDERPRSDNQSRD